MNRLSRSWRPWCLALLMPLIPASPMLAENPPPKASDTPATRQELWVPTKHLEEVLKKHPNAVIVDARQYEALVRDAGKVKPLHETTAPVGTAVEDVRVQVKVPSEALSARVEYVYTLNNLKEGWCEILLPLPVTEDESRPTGMKLVDLNAQRSVMIKPEADGVRVLTEGLGRHELRLSYVMAPGWRTGTGIISPVAPLQGARSTVVDLALPEGWRAVDRAGEAVKTGVRAALNQASGVIPIPPSKGAAARSPRQHFEVAWQRTAGERLDGRESHVRGHMACRLTADRIVGVTMLTYPVLPEMENGKLAVQVPAGVQVLGVKSDIGVLNWKTEGERLEIEGAGMAGSTRSVVISFEQSMVLPVKGTVPVTLPVFKDGKGSIFTGWNCLLLAGVGVDVRFDELSRSSTVVQQEVVDGTWVGMLREGGELFSLSGKAASDLKGDIRQHGEFLAAMSFDAPPAKTEVLVSRAPDRFSVDVDTLVAVSAHEAALTRTLLFHGEAGTTERASVTLPAGETFLGANTQCELPIEWKQVGQMLEVAWPRGLKADAKATLVVRTRKEIGSGAAEGSASESLTVTGPQVSESARTSGYVALAFDDSWKVNVTTTTGLEARDVVLSPVKGRMAWYCLKDWQLQFELTRREPVYDVGLTAYALPRAKQVEIEGQVGLIVSGAPLRKFDVKLDPKLAPLFRVTSPLVAEQVLDEATGIWHLTLRKEVLGTEDIRFRMNLPATEGGDQTLQSTMPDISTPGARRRTSAWVVEANTDTEIEFATKGVQPMDSLRPPGVQGYQPRHRVIAAFSAGSGAHEIKLTARRHVPASLAGAVVLQAKLVSVISQDGPVRHEASYTLRHNGRQFLSLALPKGVVLLSTLVQDRPVKPVQAAGANELRLPLPVLHSEADFVSAKVVYETPAMVWGSWGKTPLEPPTLLDGVPVLSSQWKVHAPEGFALRHSGGGLEPGGDVHESHQGLLAALWEHNPFLGWVTVSEPKAAAAVDFLPGGGTMAKEGEGDWWVVTQSESSQREIKDTMERLQRIILPRVDLQGASMTESLAFLELKSREHDSATPDASRKGVPFVVHPSVAQNASQISLSLTDVPLLEALRYVTELGACKFRVDPGRIVILPLTDAGTEQYTRKYKFPLRWYLKIQEMQAAANARGVETEAPTGMVSLVVMLSQQGISFPEGANAAFDPTTESLVVRNTQPNLEVFEAFLEGFQHSDREPDDAAMQEMEAKNRQGADASRYYTNKMDRIIFPRVQFQGASIEEAIEFLRIKSRDFDTVERDPSRKGTNLILKAGSTPSTAVISLDLKDVPMTEALRYVTELAGMKYKIEPYAVVVLPLSDVGTEQYTRSYKVPPSFLSLGGSGSLLGSASAIHLLKAQGIQFPEGSSAIFEPMRNTLIVRNTQPNLDQVEAFVEGVVKVARKRDAGKSSKAGLIPVALEVPAAGQVLEFSGHQKAEPLLIHYVSWEWQMFRTSLLVLLGALAFRLMGRDRPWMTSLLVVLLLTFVPPLLFPMWLPSCNALLLGWLLGFALRLLWKLLLWCTPPPTSRQMSGKEAVV